MTTNAREVFRYNSRKMGRTTRLKRFKAEHPEPDPKPPGVTVEISRIRVGCQEYCWTGRLDGAHWCACTIHAERDASGNHFLTPEVAKADAREMLTELVSRLLPDLEREGIELAIEFVEK